MQLCFGVGKPVIAHSTQPKLPHASPFQQEFGVLGDPELPDDVLAAATSQVHQVAVRSAFKRVRGWQQHRGYCTTPC